MGRQSQSLVQYQKMKNCKWQSTIEEASHTITCAFGSSKTSGPYGAVIVDTGQRGQINYF